MDRNPIASLDKLRKDGLDVARFGSCAERVKKGTKVIIMGCEHHDYCAWAHQNAPDVEVDGVKGEATLRPRNKKYVIVKRGEDGNARVRESFCSCFEWHENFSQKHGRNDTVVRITGEEGASYTARGSKRITAVPGSGSQDTWENAFWKKQVPVFTPKHNPEYEMAEEAERIIRESGLRDEQAEVRKIVGGDPVSANDVTLSLEADDVRKAIGD